MVHSSKEQRELPSSIRPIQDDLDRNIGKITYDPGIKPKGEDGDLNILLLISKNPNGLWQIQILLELDEENCILRTRIDFGNILDINQMPDTDMRTRPILEMCNGAISSDQMIEILIGSIIVPNCLLHISLDNRRVNFELTIYGHETYVVTRFADSLLPFFDIS